MDWKKRYPQLIEDALAIWHAGVAAVKPNRLFADKIQLEHQQLVIDERVTVDLRRYSRIVVVGAGKAAAGMAKALYQHHLRQLDIPTVGWINAPEGSFDPGDAGPSIHLHAGRPAAINEPTEAGVFGTQQILKLVQDCTSSDLVLVLLSGGGSALLVAPAPGIRLSDKQAVAQLISAAGGNIEQLNCVRRALSQVKGGGLARACAAGRIVTLIISDVLGDSLETIASGPTIASRTTQLSDALGVLEQLRLTNEPRLSSVVRYLLGNLNASNQSRPDSAKVEHVILANNATAVDAAGVHAVALGYRYLMQSARASEGNVMDLALHLAGATEQLLGQHQVDCLISGGEPTVRLPDKAVRGIGGRNQQLALALMHELVKKQWPIATQKFQRPLVFLSGGTDGEDGPTDAAGAWFDGKTLVDATHSPIEDFLDRCDAYRFFESYGGLIKTGPTNTNVCDLRIAIAARV